MSLLWITRWSDIHQGVGGGKVQIITWGWLVPGAQWGTPATTVTSLHCHTVSPGICHYRLRHTMYIRNISDVSSSWCGKIFHLKAQCALNGDGEPRQCPVSPHCTNIQTLQSCGRQMDFLFIFSNSEWSETSCQIIRIDIRASLVLAY